MRTVTTDVSKVRTHRCQRFDPVTEAEEGEAVTTTMTTPFRRTVQEFLNNTYVDMALSSVIIANVVLMVAETNYKAKCPEEPLDPSNIDADCHEGSMQDLALTWANYSFQFIYTIECALRLYAFRWNFFKSRWNLLDITIVFLGWVDIVVQVAMAGQSIPGPGVAILRIFRIARLLRVARILSFFPELYVMIRGFVGAMMAMFWGMFMIACLLLIWSILGVELVYPEALKLGPDYEKCQDSYSTVESCMLIFFQTVFAGDSWGSCAIPIIEHSPHTFIVFAGTLITIQLGFTNLVLAVIVERATKATEKDAESRAQEKKKQHTEASIRLHQMVEKMDKDQSGTICLGEILDGYRNMPELSRLLTLMDVSEEDLITMFELLAEEDGSASYDVLVDNLERCESDDLRRQTMLMSLQLTRIRENVLDLVKDRNVQRKTQIGGKPATLLDSQAQLHAVQQDARSQCEETLRALETSLEAQWSSLERQLNRQVQAQIAILSKHTDMLIGIAVATGSKVEEPMVVKCTSDENMKIRGSLFHDQRQSPDQRQQPEEISVQGSRKSKMSKPKKESVAGKHTLRWKDKSASLIQYEQEPETDKGDLPS